MQKILDFIYQEDRPFREVLITLHEVLTVTYGLQPKWRYRIPFYDMAGWICYLNPVPNKGIELVFVRGNELSDVHGILDRRGRKQVAGVIFDDPGRIPLRLLDDIVLEAIWLDEKDTKRKRENG